MLAGPGTEQRIHDASKVVRLPTPARPAALRATEPEVIDAAVRFYHDALAACQSREPPSRRSSRPALHRSRAHGAARWVYHRGDGTPRLEASDCHLHT